MTTEEKNVELAKMIGFVFSNDGRASRYKGIDNTTFYKTSGYLTDTLRFHSDANWQFEVIKHIRSLGYSYAIAGNKEQNTCVIHTPELGAIVGHNKDEKVAIFEALYKFSQFLKQDK